MEKSSNVKKKRSDAVKNLLKWEDLTLEELASKLKVPGRGENKGALEEMSAQNLSRRIKSESISENICKQIHDLYPQYPLEWLLGYNDFDTYEKWGNFVDNTHDKIADGIRGMIEAYLYNQGKSFRLVRDPNFISHADDRKLFPDRCYFTIVDKNEDEIRRFSTKEILQFEEKIQEYCDFLTEKYLLD